MTAEPQALAVVRVQGAPPELLAVEQMAKERKDLIRKTLAPGATPAELDLFIYDCLRRGTHPLDRMIHFTKRGDKYTPITSIDYMRSQAGETGDHAGTDDAEFVESEPYPKSAKITVYRITQGQRYGYGATARWSEYYPGDGAPGFMWRKMPHVMLAKVAEALALRKAFPRQLGGLYAREELAQAGVPSGAVEVVESLPAALRVCLRCPATAEPESDFCATCNRLMAERLADDALASAGLKPVPSAEAEQDAGRAGPAAAPPDGARPSVKPPAPESVGDVRAERNRVFAMLNFHGWQTGHAGRPDRLALYSRVLGRPVKEADAKKMTAQEWRQIGETVRMENEPPIDDAPPMGVAP